MEASQWRSTRDVPKSGMNEQNIYVQEMEGTRAIPKPDYQDAKFQSKGRGRLRALKHIVTDFWLWEILACLFSLGCLGAIVGVLYRENGRLLDDWTLPINPNALLSFVGMLAKSSFLLVVSQVLSQLKWLHYNGTSHPLIQFSRYDSASRGPLGAALLLLTSKKFLASLAAIVMMLSLLVDPFVQLVLWFPSDLVEDPSSQPIFRQLTTLNANIPGGGSYLDQVGGPFGEFYTSYTPRADLVISILKGLQVNNVTTAVDCPTGNCTWTQPVNTLAICGSCQDVTSTVKQYTTTGDFNNTVYAFQFPEKLGNITVVEVQVPTTRLNATASDWWRNLAVNHSDIAYLASFSMVDLPLMSPTTTKLPPFKASSCGLYLCEKRYTSIAVNRGNSMIAEPDETPLIFEQNSWESDTQQLAFPNGRNTSSLGIQYTANSTTTQGLSGFFEALFTFALTSSRTLGPTDDAGQIADDLSIAIPTMGSIFASSPDINSTMRILAASMTEALRAGPNSTVAPGGKSFVPRSYIRIQWSWLALPLALTALTTIMLAIVAVQTHAADLPAWKDDQLAVLMHRLDGVNEMALPPGAGIRDLEALADGLQVTLDPEEGMVFETLPFVGDDIVKTIPQHVHRYHPHHHHHHRL